MATNINIILDWFRTGKKPTQAQFWATLTSFWHKDEMIPQSSINGLTSVLNAKAEKSQFEVHKTDPNAHANLIINTRFIPIGQRLVFKHSSNDNPDNINQQEQGDFVIGFVENQWIQGYFLGGDNNNLNNYDVVTSA
ncbi:hypothetical protein N4T20_02450 [Flavobacterium sp. TR2]|uniref:hypothetical protein n=1 Tax=Flavobacterium sp. TR2 TaxID=2977321 RepID=UPI0021B0FCEC|nr:hypothetical protein [Flavobacterium sp. TR2]UWY28791.1 hypothetical protein N4T20_02450 [Flavobacterium sp. TR2]